MKSEQERNFLSLISLVSFGMSLLVHFNSVILLFSAGSNAGSVSNGNENIIEVLSNIVTTTVLTFSIFLINYYIVEPDKILKKIGTKKMIVSALVTVLSTLILSEFFFFINHLLTNNINQESKHLFYFIKDIFIAFVVYTGIYMLKVFNERQAMLMENEKIKLENLKNQYKSLKNQINPHFLFNSLAAVDELIETDSSKARLYVNHLSNMLRASLHGNDNITVTLSEEMKTVDSYLFMLSLRFGTNLKIELNIHGDYNYFKLPPLVVQTLIENAVKHNEVSRRNPLLIRIFTTGNRTLVVSNTLRPRLTPEPGSGIGLTNISTQYRLLCPEEIRILKTKSEFEVEIPLIKP